MPVEIMGHDFLQAYADIGTEKFAKNQPHQSSGQHCLTLQRGSEFEEGASVEQWLSYTGLHSYTCVHLGKFQSLGFLFYKTTLVKPPSRVVMTIT